MAFDDDDLMFDKPRINKPLVGVVAAVIVLAGAVAWFLHSRSGGGGLPKIPVSAQSPAGPAAESAPAIAHPVPVPAETGQPKAPLPALADSDASLKEALSGAAGGADITRYLVPDSIIRHLVVTVDNLSRQKVALDKRPAVPAPGTLVVVGDELHSTLNERNYARYQPMVNVVRGLDMQHVAAVYFRFYPLFQHTYQDLGYPNGYFNDRLVQVIDVLLATPQPPAPIELVRPNVMYVFADSHLESLPAGQKLLIRMGPDNAAAIKKKLMELRAIVVAAPPKS